MTSKNRCFSPSCNSIGLRPSDPRHSDNRNSDHPNFARWANQRMSPHRQAASRRCTSGVRRGITCRIAVFPTWFRSYRRRCDVSTLGRTPAWARDSRILFGIALRIVPIAANKQLRGTYSPQTDRCPVPTDEFKRLRSETLRSTTPCVSQRCDSGGVF